MLRLNNPYIPDYIPRIKDKNQQQPQQQQQGGGGLNKLNIIKDALSTAPATDTATSGLNSTVTGEILGSASTAGASTAGAGTYGFGNVGATAGLNTTLTSQLVGSGGAASAGGATTGINTALTGQLLGTGAASGGTAASAGGASVSAASGGGGVSAGGGMAAAGPWALLAAAIIANEDAAKSGGYRDDKSSGYALDVLQGKVLEQDVHQRWSPKIFGEDLENDILGVGGRLEGITDIMTGDISNGVQSFIDADPIVKLFKDIF